MAHILSNSKRGDRGGKGVHNIALNTVKKRIIDAWTKKDYYEHYIPTNPENAVERDPKYKELKEKGKRAFLIYTSQELTESGLQQMINDFVMWAFPEAQIMAQKISEKISPATYSEIFKIFSRGRVE